MPRRFNSFLEQQLVVVISAATSSDIHYAVKLIEERAKKDNLTVPVSYKFFLYGYIKLKESRYEEALEFFSKSLSHLNKHNQLRYLRYYIEYGMGVVFIRLSQFSDAVSSLTKTLKIKNYARQEEIIFRTYNNIGIVFLLSNDHEQAYAYFTLARDYITDNTVLSSSPFLTNYAYANALVGKFEEAAELYCKMENELKNKPSTLGGFFLYNSKGSFYDLQEEPKLALASFDKAIELSIELNDYFYQLDALKEYCVCAIKYGLDDKVIGYVSDALLLIKDYGTPSSISYFSDTLMYLSDKYAATEQQVILMKQAYELQSRALELHSNNNQGSITELYRLHSERPELENAKSLEQNLELVTSFGEYLNSHSSLDEITFKLYDDLKQVMPLDCLSIGLYDNQTAQLHYDHFLDLGVPLEPFVIDCNNEITLSSYCIQQKKPFLHGDFSSQLLIELLGQHTEQAFVGNTDESYPSIMMLPLILEGEVIGIFSIQTFKHHAYQGYQFSLVKQLASYLAIDIRNKQQRQQLIEQKKELNRLANIDPLTGLLNRKSLFSSIKEWSSSSENLTILLIDIDYYKQFNDLYGHIKGDEILVRFSALLKSHFYLDTHKVFRYGGDEFLVLIHGEEHMKLVELFIQLRSHVQEQEIAHKGSLCSDVITLSIGGYQFFPCEMMGLSINELIHKADEALYSIKNKGRNGLFINRS